jgi:hypothetical protein
MCRKGPQDTLPLHAGLCEGSRVATFWGVRVSQSGCRFHHLHVPPRQDDQFPSVAADDQELEVDEPLEVVAHSALYSADGGLARRAGRSCRASALDAEKGYEDGIVQPEVAGVKESRSSECENLV